MTRTEALTLAQKTVTEMSTNARGYQDGCPFEARVSAVLRLAEFLMTGENPDDDRT
ncbi:hypothetical protein OG455_38950 [Kitasatospora sp. NBC_01287]|uniref:hypothetical protein n=1 Tax=Kitasatospora sp. NBC_01287 TaxID=2903573 RepID=UPI00225AAB43|nr:hypothetical protein [Kitasatospora sp. NBC_01287]MCX4751414.1 hypothetical protein [Kitasatospora sp. NBC_01287]